MMLNKVGGRKFILAIITIAAAIAVDVGTEKGLSDGLINTLIGILALFVTGNHLERKESRKQTPIENVTQQLQLYPDITHNDQELHNKVDQLTQIAVNSAEVQKVVAEKLFKHLPQE
jgi:hypothetical protein